MAKDKGGRPTVMTEQTLYKLQEAYLLDCTDEEACFNADICMATLYNYQKDNPDFLEKKKLWKQNPFMVARKTIMKGLKEDHNHALKYMKNKKSDEFSEQTKTDLTSKGEKMILGLPISQFFTGSHDESDLPPDTEATGVS